MKRSTLFWIIVFVFAFYVGHSLSNLRSVSTISSSRTAPTTITKNKVVATFLPLPTDEDDSNNNNNNNNEVAETTSSPSPSPHNTISHHRPSQPEPLERYFLSDDELSSSSNAGGTSTAKCIRRGMQEKCLFTHLHVDKNVFSLFGPNVRGSAYPNPIFPPDGLAEPLIKYHKYRGHKIKILDGADKASKCKHVVRRLAVFTYRMSGHSTYHLWENNLGPFFDTLQSWDSSTNARANDPRELIVVYVDDKPKTGPKAPHLLDTLLQTFSNVKLVDAKTLDNVCFTNAIVGTSSNHFDHYRLLHTMMKNIVGHLPDDLPGVPKVVYSSRNHVSVTRGRKVANEAEVVRAINATVLRLTGQPLHGYWFMQEYDYPTQVEMSMHSQILISPHGGGIANCIWMPKGSVVVEFVAPVGKTLTNMYHAMCGRSGVSHNPFVADADPADAGLTPEQLNNNPRLFSNIYVPVEKMVQNVEKAIHTYRANRQKLYH
eukprot:PhM_4_TR2668/c0_g1_i1/m.71725